MTIEVGLLLTITGLICTVIGLLTGFLTFRLRRDQDIKNEASSDATIETKLDNIYRLVDKMIDDLRDSEKRWNDVNLIVTRLDEKLNSVYRRFELINKEKEKEKEK